MQSRVISGLRDIADDYDGYILDQYGVLHDGAKPIQGVLPAMQELLSRGKKLLILSNASRRLDFAEVCRIVG
jgi:ribonucleotide monophosphatase NagD (HAD superfamily)